MTNRRVGRVAVGLMWVVAALVGCRASEAQVAPSSTIPVLMLSDLHFDPFRDIAKVPRLAATSITEWDAILKEPNSATRAADYQALQTACKATKALDTDYSLLRSALKAAHAQAADAKFVTIAGDLVVHQFDCRFKTVMKTDDAAAYSSFAEKTASFAVMSVENEFAGVPVYAALGNNDSGCGDYRLDVNDRFLAGTSAAMTAGMRGANAAELKQARADYLAGGNFAVTLPGPMQRTRLLVTDDMYMSRRYSDCAKKVDPAGEAAELTWLKRQVDVARQQGERVWVMGHIPPGIDVYATLRKGDVCADATPEMFLDPAATQAVGQVLAGHADVVKLAIFGHTHMDEFKLLQTAAGAVALKQVPSISPVDGNLPSFTVAQVDPVKATLVDWTVYVASDKDGTAWTREYRFSEAYHQPDFTAASVARIVAEFRGDPAGATPVSKAYQKYFDKGLPISPLVIAWPQYGCGVDHFSEDGFKACMCAAK